MTLRWPSSEDIVLGLTVPPPASDWFGDVFRHVPVAQLRLSEKEQAYHAAIFGTSGSGKSKMLQSVFLQHLSRNHGVGIVDPHADLAMDIIKYLVSRGYFRS
jgi:late competence protein required for DNA uptake (superfamily II DNA/RNA helicase)